MSLCYLTYVFHVSMCYIEATVCSIRYFYLLKKPGHFFVQLIGNLCYRLTLAYDQSGNLENFVVKQE